MKLKQLFQSIEFDELFPYVATMYPNARHHRHCFEHAYDIMVGMRAMAGVKKYIRYQLMQDEASGDSFFGAPDMCFRGSWEMLLGKDVRKDGKVDLSDVEIAANCLINMIFIGTHPREYEQEYNELIRS